MFNSCLRNTAHLMMLSVIENGLCRGTVASISVQKQTSKDNEKSSTAEPRKRKEKVRVSICKRAAHFSQRNRAQARAIDYNFLINCKHCTKNTCIYFYSSIFYGTHFYDVMFTEASSYLPSSNFIDCFQSENI